MSKICDQISDAILDELIKQDPDTRTGIECLATTGLVVIAGEINTKGKIDYQNVARNVIKDIGYTNIEYGLDYNSCAILVTVHQQSPDISQGVSENEGEYKEQGAGDQGLMFGYATNETKSFMPLPIDLAHKLTLRLSEVRKNNIVNWMRPDGKSQVTVEYQDGKPVRVDTVVISIQHHPETSNEQIKQDVLEHVIKPICGNWLDENTKYFINPTGKFVIGGPHADTGLTGRKIIVDTYGGHGSHGGGAMSGKCPTKVDRSAAYMSRHVAKNVVAAGLAEKCEVQVAYAIGVAQPVSILVNTFGTNKVPEEKIEEAVRKNFDFRPKAIIEYLDLKRPIFRKTAAYGHFGRDDKDFTWEYTNKAKDLARDAGLSVQTSLESQLQESHTQHEFVTS